MQPQKLGGNRLQPRLSLVAPRVDDKGELSIVAAAVIMLMAVVTETKYQSFFLYFMEESRASHRKIHFCTPRGCGREQERRVNRKRRANALKSYRAHAGERHLKERGTTRHLQNTGVG